MFRRSAAQRAEQGSSPLARRRSRRRQTLEQILGNLPRRFYEPDPATEDGSMTGLSAYHRDLDGWLRRELRLPPAGDPRGSNAPTVEVMTLLGIEPSEWYRYNLTAHATR